MAKKPALHVAFWVHAFVSGERPIASCSIFVQDDNNMTIGKSFAPSAYATLDPVPGDQNISTYDLARHAIKLANDVVDAMEMGGRKVKPSPEDLISLTVKISDALIASREAMVRGEQSSIYRM